MHLAVLIPVYNNGSTIAELVARVISAAQECSGGLDIWCVDDGSADDSWEQLCAMALTESRLKLLRLSRNFGQHAAIAAALEHARADVYVLMDADLQDVPEEIPILVTTLTSEQVDVVYTRKTGTVSDGLVQGLTSNLFHRVVARESAGVAIPAIGTFRVFSDEIACALRGFGESSVVYGPLMQSIGFRWVVVPVVRSLRPEGRSSYTFSKRLDLAIQSLVSYSRIPQRVFFGIGIATMSFCLLYGLAVLIQYWLFGAQMPPGITLMLVLGISMMGMIMAAVGVVAAYLFAIHREVLARPRYLVWKRVNLERTHDNER